MKSFKRSLYSVLMTNIIFTVIAVISVQSYLMYANTKDDMVLEIKKASKISIEALAKNISKYIEEYSVSGYTNLIFNEMAHRDFLAIVVEDYNMGKILGRDVYISGKIRDNNKEVVDFDSKNKKHFKQLADSYYYDEKNIIGVSGKIIGNVKIYSTNYFIDLQRFEIMKSIIINSFLIFIFLVIALFLSIRFSILKPISSIIDIIKNSDDKGIPTKKLSVSGTKEIEILADAMNKMINSIKDSNVELNKQKNDLKAFNKNLEKLVSIRTQELKKTQKHMVQTQKMAALGSLVAGVAHEINTPVGLGITGLSHFLKETTTIKELYKNEQMTKDDFEKYLNTSAEIAQISYKNLERAAEIIKNFKQISVDQTNEQARMFNLKNYIEDTLISLSSRVKHTSIEVKLNCPSDLVIFSYPGAFSQIITNLIINSIAHGYDKGDKGIINIDIEVKKSVLKFVYKDDGKGISKENIVKIFDLFFTTNRANGGSGLGLNIVHNIVIELLKGTIECKSEKMQCTKFIITIPLEQN